MASPGTFSHGNQIMVLMWSCGQSLVAQTFLWEKPHNLNFTRIWQEKPLLMRVAVVRLQQIGTGTTISHIISETNFPPPLSMLFASIWYSFLAQASVLLSYQYTVTLSRRKWPDLFLESGPFQNFQKFFQDVNWSQ